MKEPRDETESKALLVEVCRTLTEILDRLEADRALLGLQRHDEDSWALVVAPTSDRLVDDLRQVNLQYCSDSGGEASWFAPAVYMRKIGNSGRVMANVQIAHFIDFDQADFVAPDSSDVRHKVVQELTPVLKRLAALPRLDSILDPQAVVQQLMSEIRRR